MEGALILLSWCKQVLVELLAGPQTRVDDVDWPGHSRHEPTGHVGDPDLLTHVEHEHLAVATDGCCLEDQLHRFVGGHEVAAYLWMCHRDRTTRGHLRGHGGQHRASAAEDIAEAHAQVRSVRVVRHVGGEPLCSALRVAQHADRVGGLVRGDVHERLDAAGSGGL